MLVFHRRSTNWNPRLDGHPRDARSPDRGYSARAGWSRRHRCPPDTRSEQPPVRSDPRHLVRLRLVDTIILAGGSIETERFPGFDPAVHRKAQIPVQGRPMVEWTAAAVRASPGVKRIVVVGDAALDTPSLR